MEYGRARGARVRPYVGSGLMPPLSIQTTDPRETRVALRHCLAASDWNEIELERHVSTFMAYARSMSIDLSRIWHCESGGRWISSCVCIESPGRTAMLLLPAGGTEGSDPGALRQLIEHAAGEESARDMHLLQALIELEDGVNRRVLEETGFRQIAVLQYLELTLKRGRGCSRPAAPAGFGRGDLEWRHYGPEIHSAFSDLIRATYEGSLDCPGLGAMREMEDVIAGHKSVGRFDPRRWQLLTCAGAAAGCLLLGAHPLLPMLELVYMGVHPAFRGGGLGRFILDYGLYMTHRESCRSMTLAVDANNEPARRLYERAGFRRTHSRRAMIRPLRLSPEKT